MMKIHVEHPWKREIGSLFRILLSPCLQWLTALLVAATSFVLAAQGVQAANLSGELEPGHALTNSMGRLDAGQDFLVTPWVVVSAVAIGAALLFILGLAVFTRHLNKEVLKRTSRLKESEDQFRILVNTVGEGIFLQLASGEIVEWNQTAADVFGLEVEDAVGETSTSRDWSTIYPDGSPFPGDKHPSMLTLRTGEPCDNVVMGVRRPEQKTVWIKVNTRPLFMEGSTSPYAVVGSFSGITERELFQEALQKSEARYRRLVDSSMDAIYLLDKDGKALDVNPAACDALGRDREELLSLSIKDIDPNFDREAFRAFWENQPEDMPLLFETSHLRSDGTEFPVEVNGMVFSEGGEKYFYGIARDITERKLSEQAVVERELELRRSQRRTKTGTWEYNILTGDNRWSDEMFFLYGYEPQEIEPTYAFNVEHVLHDDNKDIFDRVLGDILQGIEPAPFEYKAMKKDGSMAWFLSVMEVESNPDGELVRILGTAQDITERKRAEEALIRSSAMMSSFLDNAPAPAFLKDRQGKYLFVNRNYAERVHRSQDEMVGLRDDDIVAEFDTARRFQDNDALVFENLEVMAEESTFTVASGEYSFVTLKFPVFDEQGVVYAVGGVAFDITELKQKEEALRESENRFRALFEHAGWAVFVHDLNGRFLDVNRRSCEQLGYNREELLAMNVVDVDPDAENRGDKESIWLGDLPKEFAFEGRHQRKDGSIYPATINLSRIEYAGQSVIIAMVLDETARKQVEDALKESEERMQLALDAVNDAVWDWRTDSGEVYFSSRWYTLLGYEPYEMPEEFETWRKLVHPDDLQPSEETIFRHLKNGEPFHLEFRMRAKDGEWRWIKARGMVVEQDESGRAVRMLGTHQDITGRKHAEEALRTGAARLRDAQAMGKVGSWEFDLQTEKIWGSDEGFHIYGMTPPPSNLLSIDDIEACIPERERVNKALVDLINEDKPYDLEFDILPADGSARKTIVSKARLERDAEGNPLRVSGVILDITDRKRAEEERGHLFQLIDSAESIAVMKDKDLRYLNVNRAYLKLTGYEDVSTLVGKTDADLFKGLATAGQIREYMDNDRKALLLPKGEYLTIEERFPGEDGLERTFLTKKFPVYSDNTGELSGVATLTSEITDLKRLEQSLIESKEEAETANRAKSQFLANMSHEIRTPLNGLMGMLQLMNTTPLNPEQKEFIHTAVQSSNRLLRLLTDILDLSRVEAEKIEILSEPFDFRDAIDSVLQLFSPAAWEKGLDLRVELNQGIPQILLGDVVRLQQVLSNLLGNAIKFTSKGSVDIDAHPLPPRRPEEYRVLFSLTDTGIGISDEILARLFKPFTQGEASFTRTYQGAGLGLAISKHLVGLMGGNMAVESDVGIGSSFHFCITFKRANQVGAVQASDEQAADIGGLKVLVVEDDRTSRIIAQRCLEKWGHQAHAAGNGKEALDMLGAERFDLVLMDIQMPILDGIEATKALRKGDVGGDNQHIPIIAMTAYAMAGDKETFLEAGMSGYVAKPVDMEDLKRVMERVLDQGQ